MDCQYLFGCEEYPCERYDGASLYDSFITHRNQIRDLDKAKQMGLAAYEAELNEKVRVLEKLLNGFDDGRRKSFYCAAVNLLDLPDIEDVMEQLGDAIDSESPLKTKAAAATRLLEDMAEKSGISLQLRKKAKQPGFAYAEEHLVRQSTSPLRSTKLCSYKEAVNLNKMLLDTTLWYFHNQKCRLIHQLPRLQQRKNHLLQICKWNRILPCMCSLERYSSFRSLRQNMQG